MRDFVLASALAAVFAWGCSPGGGADADLTSGNIAVVCSPDARDVMSRCVAAFQRLYPQARIDVRPGTSRNAIAAVFGAQADMAVITRELVPEERRAAVQGKLELAGYRFARDAAVLIVNPSNPVDHLTLADLQRIYRGELKRWSELGGTTTPIVPVVQTPDADLTEFFIEEVLGGEAIHARAVSVDSDSDVVRTVREQPGAIGYITLSHAGLGARVVKLAALKGLPYYAPDLELVHDGKYPVTRFYNMYVREGGPALANGFITFVTSLEGQRLIREAGFVPTSVPVRFVRRSPMLSTHTQGDSSNTP